VLNGKTAGRFADVIGEAGYETLVLPSSAGVACDAVVRASWCSGGASSAERAWAAGERQW
jgi:hypothetical protein